MHVKKALDIAFEHNTLLTLSFLLFYNRATVEQVLNEYPPDKSALIRNLSDDYIGVRNAYACYRGKKPLLSGLNEKDYRLLSCCLNKKSIDRMAKELGITRSGVNKRLSALYRKLGVKSNRELNRLFTDSVLDWN